MGSSYEAVEIDLSTYGDMSVWLRWRDVTDASFSAYGTGVDAITIEEIPMEMVDWNNLQHPPTAEITEGGSFDVYAQVYEPGVTDTSDGAGEGIEAWFGISTEDTDPATWDTWVEAEFNTSVGNNDEYTVNWGST